MKKIEYTLNYILDGKKEKKMNIKHQIRDNQSLGKYMV